MGRTNIDPDELDATVGLDSDQVLVRVDVTKGGPDGFTRRTLELIGNDWRDNGTEVPFHGILEGNEGRCLLEVLGRGASRTPAIDSRLLLQVLDEVEWCVPSGRDGEGYKCPMCDAWAINEPPEEHDPGCRLDRLLKQAKAANRL